MRSPLGEVIKAQASVPRSAIITRIAWSVTAAHVLGRLPEADQRDIKTFRDALRAEFGQRLRDIRLFGSKARGEWHEESDIDVLVLIDGCSWSDRDWVLRAASSISLGIMPAVFDHESYHASRSRATGFYEEMRQESVRL